MTAQAPLASFDPAGVAQVVSYDVPEPSSYAGQNFIELAYDKAYFQPRLLQPAANPEPAADMIRGGTGSAAPPTAVGPGAAAPTRGPTTAAPAPAPAATLPGVIVRKRGLPATAADSDALKAVAQSGKRITLRKSMSGQLQVVPRPKLDPPRPVFLIVETLVLSNFASAYGAGRIVKTMTLMPGEKTTMSVKTFTRSESTRREASSILDSFTEESANEFEETLSSEQTSQDSLEKSTDYYVDADAHATWGWGSANVSGGVSGSTNTAREETAKAVASTTSKVSAKASSRRDVQVDTSYEVQESSGEETAIVREIQNVNVGHTLNFTFRQMNQEFVSILHLVDIRVAAFNGQPGSRDEVPLSQLDELIARSVVDDPAKRAEIKSDILGAAQTIVDWRGDRVTDMVVERSYAEPGAAAPSKRWAINRDRLSQYSDPVTKRAITVPGVILSVQHNVMRTEGLVVEALLGQASALDDYALGLQDEEVAARQRQNELAALAVERERLALDIVKARDADQAALFEKVFGRKPAA